MKTLEEVAQTYAKLSQLYMISGNWKPAYKTGNLYNTIGSYNTAAQMIRSAATTTTTELQLPQQTISLQFAPPGAEYGKWVEWGNGTGVGAGKPRPFAKQASNDPLLKKTIDEYMGGVIQKDFIPVIEIGIKRAFKNLAAERAAR
jgi:hypothetical protein